MSELIAKSRPADASTHHPVRLIARLDIKAPNVVKGVHLEGLRVVGKPGELARRYYRDGIDEIIYMDIVASLYQRNSILALVEEAARDVFVPLTVGGGIRTLEDIADALRRGADKVAINTAAIRRPDFIAEAARAFGSQCIVLSVEAGRWADGRPGWEALTDNGRERTGVDVQGWVKQAESLGAGEFLVTSVEREGTAKGLDLALLHAVHSAVTVPVIASGGVGQPEHAAAAFAEDAAEAVACAHVLHYGLHGVQGLKHHLADRGVPIRYSPC